MRFNLRAYTKFFYKKDKSLNSALKKIIGKKNLDTVLAQSTDWRELANDVANLFPDVGVQVHQQIADYFNVPFIARVPAIDLSLLPSHVTAEDLKRFACVPRINHNQVTSFICLDPRRAASLFPAEKPLPFAIASWAGIRSALTESEAAHRAKTEEAREKEALQLVEAAKQALNLVVAQVKNFGIYEFIVSLSDDKQFTYSFHTKEGKQGKGSINAKVSAALLGLLANYAAKDNAVLTISDIVRQPLKVSRLENKEAYTVEVLNEIPQAVAPAANVISFPENHIHIAKNSIKESAFKPSKEYKLLIVDDNQVFAKVLERFLEKLNVKTTYAPNGAKALSLLADKSYQPDIIICDLHMPEMNGCEFTKRIREELALLDLPIIILTSDDDVETELRLLTEGADAFIAKSEDPRLLCIKVQKLIEKAERRHAA